MTPHCLNIGHRGASAVAPENTLIAFHKAIEAGADMVEFDIHLTRDNQFVVIHDKNVSRTTCGSGLVTEMTLDEVKKFDAGTRFSPAYAGEKIPTLEEVIAVTRGKIGLNIEVKASHPSEDLVVTRLLDVLREQDAEREVLVSCFNTSILKKLRERSPIVRTGFLFALNVIGSPLSTAKAIGANALHPSVAVVSSNLIKQAHDEGMAVYVWTEDDPKQMCRLQKMGVDGIMTNNPLVLRNVLITT